MPQRRKPARRSNSPPSPASYFLELPDDLLDATLHPLGPRELCVAVVVCQRWRAAAGRLRASVPWMAAHLSLHDLLRERRPPRAIIELSLIHI